MYVDEKKMKYDRQKPRPKRERNVPKVFQRKD